MLPASNAAERDAVSVKDPDGLRFLAVVWYIHMYWKCAELIRMNIQDLHLV